MSDATLDTAERRDLLRQLRVSRVLSPIWVPAFAAVMRFVMRWRLIDAGPARAEYRRIIESGEGPILVCANHLTMLDSFAVSWALGSPRFFLRHFRALPWNTPERANFADSWWKRWLVYVLKCVPVERGSDRKAVAQVLERVRFLIEQGETALVFPEGGRSRTSRVELDSAAYGVGRLIGALPGCRVVCVYLRGESQDEWSAFPQRGERFRVAVSCIEPKTDQRGLRASMDLSRQVVARLIEMEAHYFDERAAAGERG